MELTMSMFATQADYWKARAELAEKTVEETARELGCENDNEEILLAIAALKPTWQPIETAPRDGSRMLLFFPPPNEYFKTTVEVGRWNDDQYAKRPRPYFTGDMERTFGVSRYRDYQPTHWMPLPAPPVLCAPSEGAK